MRAFKKALVFWGVVFIFTACSGGVSAQVICDVNGDGVVDPTDKSIVLQILAGASSPFADVSADMNGDGRIGMEEAIYIDEMLSGSRMQIAFSDSTALALGTGTGNTDDEITVPVTAGGNNAGGIAGAVFTIGYDSSAVILTAVETDFFSAYESNTDEAAGKTMIAGTGSQNAQNSGDVLFALSFRLKEGASSGTYDISVSNTVLNTAGAGYSGEAVDLLYGSDPDTPGVYPVIDTSLTNGAVTFINGAGGTAPDLIIQNQNATPTSLKAGSEISVSCDVINQGDASSATSTIIRYDLSADAVYNSGDTLLGTGSVDGLPASGTNSKTAALTIPSGTSPGTWYLLFRADADGEVTESDEENNLSYHEITVISDPPTPPANPEARSGVNSVRLHWDSSTSAHIEGYNVYRSESDAGPWTRITTDPVTGEDYVETSALSAGVTYYYCLKTVDTFGNESDCSEVASAVFGQLKLFIPDVRGNGNTPVRLQVNIANADSLALCGLNIYVTYDKNVLEATGIERSPLSSAYKWDYRVNDSGVVKAVLAAGSGDEPLNGEGTLFWLNFNVKGSEGDSSELKFQVDGTSMYDCADPDPNAFTLDLNDIGIFTVSSENILCDLNGDGGVDSGDVAFLLSLATGNSELTEELLNIGDASGDGRIRSNDVIICTRIAATEELAPPASERKRKFSRASSVNISVPDNLSVSACGSIRIPVHISDAKDVAGADIVLNYDPNLVTATNVRTTSITESCDLDFKVGAGQVRISLSTKGVSTLPGGSGALVEVEFTVQPDVSKSSVSPLTLTSVRLNDTYSRDFATSALQADVNTISGSLKIEGNANDLSGAILILKMSAGMDVESCISLALDADKSGKVGMEDVILILQNIAGTRR